LDLNGNLSSEINAGAVWQLTAILYTY